MKQGLLFVLIGTMLVTLFLGGCSKKEEEVQREAPGTLIRVLYERTNGSIHGEDFSINLTPDKIQYAQYFDEDELEYQEVIDQSISEKQWSEIEAVVLKMVPEVDPIKKSNIIKQTWSEFMHENVQVLDGGDSQRLTLIWKTDTGELEENYAYNTAESYYALLDLLGEIVIPQ